MKLFLMIPLNCDCFVQTLNKMEAEAIRLFEGMFPIAWAEKKLDEIDRKHKQNDLL